MNSLFNGEIVYLTQFSSLNQIVTIIILFVPMLVNTCYTLSLPPINNDSFSFDYKERWAKRYQRCHLVLVTKRHYKSYEEIKKEMEDRGGINIFMCLMSASVKWNTRSNFNFFIYILLLPYIMTCVHIYTCFLLEYLDKDVKLKYSTMDEDSISAKFTRSLFNQ